MSIVRGALGQPDGQAGTGNTTATAAERGKNASRSSNLEAVCHYIQCGQAAGMTAEEISQELLVNGWSAPIIAQAWDLTRGRK